MKIVNFNRSWGQMVTAHARGHQLIKLGVEDVRVDVARHNNAQKQVMEAYASQGYRVYAA